MAVPVQCDAAQCGAMVVREFAVRCAGGTRAASRFLTNCVESWRARGVIAQFFAPSIVDARTQNAKSFFNFC